MTFFDRLRPLGLLLMRLGLGAIFVYHGYAKLFSHPERAQHFFVEIGLSPIMANVAGIVELFGGCMLILGLYTRIGALVLAIEMVIAIWKAHSGEGVLAINEYEYALTLAVSTFALATVGAGQVSLDYAIFRQKA
jgi:putative oxidoreductase